MTNQAIHLSGAAMDRRLSPPPPWRRWAPRLGAGLILAGLLAGLLLWGRQAQTKTLLAP